MERVRKIVHKDKEILVLDFSDCRGDKMIEVWDHAKSVVLSDNKRFLALNILSNKTFVSPQFIRHVEKHLQEVDELLDKNAIVGVSKVQKWIIKGINLWSKRELITFDSMNDALDYLTE